MLQHSSVEKGQTVADAYSFLGITPNSDGSFTRQILIPMVPATAELNSNSDNQIPLSKDIPINPRTKCFVRLYRPINPPSDTKIPLIINFHGGDFVLYSATTQVYHDFCNNIAAQVPAIVASVEYRLAPEHRLPGAYEDALDAIMWAKDQALNAQCSDPWIQEYADFSRVFLLGSSAGGNIAYHAALRTVDYHLEPIKILGVIMNQPFFGGVQKTASELRLIDDAYIPLYVADVLWSLALPKNANLDHEFSNPLMEGMNSSRVDRLPRCMMIGFSEDPLVDRAKQLVRLLTSHGIDVVSSFNEGGYHGVELNDSKVARGLYNDVKDFITSTCDKVSRVSVDDHHHQHHLLHVHHHHDHLLHHHHQSSFQK